MRTEPASDEGPGEACQMPVKRCTDLFESLYVENTYIIEIADELGVRVPRSVINKYPTFASQFVGHYLDLSELDKNGARVLVHYLYTGEYQTLEPEAASPDEKRLKTFALNLMVHFAGVACGLEHLAVLASIELTKLGKDLAFIEILDIMEREEYEIGEDEVWFARYMADRAQRLEPVTEAQVQSFRARIGEKRTLVNILIESVLNLKLEVQRQKTLLEDGNGQG
ncbi:hypothetical protein NW759_002994 [Fusarium solani]|nr:hypothetical protein NW759_002994 [Fusarium solani]